MIDQYAAGPGRLRAAVDGLSREALLAPPADGSWTLLQIVVHLTDADLVSADRMKRVIAEERPPLIGFDETRFAAALHYHQQPLDELLDLFELNRAHMARILRQLPPSAFDRVGVHSERGEVRLADLVTGMIDHLEHHLGFIARKRSSLG